MSDRLRTALSTYQEAKGYVAAAGFQEEVEWQRTRESCRFTEGEFLCEAAWVILCSGFRELYVRRIFDYISLCFCDWESARCILRHAKGCRSTALAGFNYPQKIDAIIGVAREVQRVGFDVLHGRILQFERCGRRKAAED